MSSTQGSETGDSQLLRALRLLHAPDKTQTVIAGPAPSLMVEALEYIQQVIIGEDRGVFEYLAAKNIWILWFVVQPEDRKKCPWLAIRQDIMELLIVCEDDLGAPSTKEGKVTIV